jgi:NADH dehydrogenase (ubiquinone) 1 alpha subcomplex subunit 9
MRRNSVAAVRRASSASGAYLNVRQPTVHNMPEVKTAGTGGRHSNSGITATVFGSYGFVGKYLMNSLGGCGSRAYVPFRGDEMDVREVRQCFDNGQVNMPPTLFYCFYCVILVSLIKQIGLIPFSPRDHDSIRESIRRSDVVINLIGKHYETKHAVPTRRENGTLSRVNYSLEEVNVTIPQTLARLAREAGASTFIHVSALSANENSASRFSQTKAIGEKAVRQEFPEAVRRFFSCIKLCGYASDLKRSDYSTTCQYFRS